MLATQMRYWKPVKKALSYTASPSYKSIKNLLVTGSEKLASETIDTKTTHKAHGITRGADYYPEVNTYDQSEYNG